MVGALPQSCIKNGGSKIRLHKTLNILVDFIHNQVNLPNLREIIDMQIIRAYRGSDVSNC